MKTTEPMKPPFPRVTVVIPTYEQEELTLEAARSALAQDYPNLEVIVVDDASPRATYDALKQIDDARFKYVRNERNLGRVANYRHGLYEVATGEWVTNLDGDDFYTDPSFISQAIKVAANDPTVVMVSARGTTWTRRGKELSPTPGNISVLGVDLVGALPRPEYLLMHLATLYRRVDALATDFYRMSTISADWESLYRLALRGRVAFIDRNVGVWRIHGANASNSSDWRTLARNLEVWPFQNGR